MFAWKRLFPTRLINGGRLVFPSVLSPITGDIEMTRRHILAIDGGGTKTRAALAQSDGQVVARATGAYSNLTSDFNGSLQNIETVIAAVYSAANVSMESCIDDVAIIGSAGANVGNVANELAAALRFAAVRVMSDREITVASILADGDGTLAQVGTGSFFVSRYKGQLKQVGGWGLQLGDDCSGAWLGRELLRLTLRAHDGLIGTTDLFARTLTRFDNSPSDIVLFSKTATPQHYGEFARTIFDSYESGDKGAEMIINRALHDLEAILKSIDVIKTGRLYLNGSVGKRYEAILSEDIKALVLPSPEDGLSGAISLGLKILRQLPSAK